MYSPHRARPPPPHHSSYLHPPMKSCVFVLAGPYAGKGCATPFLRRAKETRPRAQFLHVEVYRQSVRAKRQVYFLWGYLEQSILIDCCTAVTAALVVGETLFPCTHARKLFNRPSFGGRSVVLVGLRGSFGASMSPIWWVYSCPIARYQKNVSNGGIDWRGFTHVCDLFDGFFYWNRVPACPLNGKRICLVVGVIPQIRRWRTSAMFTRGNTQLFCAQVCLIDLCIFVA